MSSTEPPVNDLTLQGPALDERPDHGQPPAPTGDGGGSAVPRQSVAERLVGRFGLVVAWLVVVVVFSLLEPDYFLTSTNFTNIFGSQSVLLILTIGVLWPLAVGEFDASIAGVLSVSMMLVGYLNVLQGWPIGAAVAIAIAAGVVVGTINALVIVRLGVDSLVATLGMGTLLLGVAMGISNLSLSGVSGTLVDVSRTKVFGLQLAFYYGLAFTVVTWYVFHWTPLGRYIFFVGANRDVAKLAGLRVDGIRAASLIISATVAAIGGVVLTGVLGSADPTTGASYLLPAFAAAFLGATAVTPGRFNPWGSFIAIYFLITGITGLQLVGLSGWIEQVFYGGALVVAVTLSRLATARIKS